MDPSKAPLIFFLLSFATLSFSNPTSIDWWCRLVPHQDACRHYLAAHTHSLKDHSDFYRLSVKAALDLSISARSRIKRLAKGFINNDPDKTALLDCWNLLGNTVTKLNHTLSLSGGNRRAGLDAQTWLSAAHTNLYTCLHGFSDIHPITRYNVVSELVSNCLAINSAAASIPETLKPRWTSFAGRRLLSSRADIVVSQDGSGNFRTIIAALDIAAVERRSTSRRIVIYVKAGVYEENLEIVSSLTDITIAGDGKGKTIITGNRSAASGYTTFSSPTVNVFGDGFIATDITIRNTFGPGSQAVALLSGSDRSVFYRCSIEGYQDTLCVYSQRQFYRECDIYGTIDFIFGNAAAVIQNCNIIVRTPLKGESNVITAQGRTDGNQSTGIVIQFSRITAAPEFWPVHRTVKSYLGRPWLPYSRTVYMQNFIDSIIDPAGWLSLNGDLDTVYYAEYKNTGPGAKAMRLRVKWTGFHIIFRPSEVTQFTVERFLEGNTWLTATAVPFDSGL
ncbi:hypothetical protein KFK09_018013 [Dendrobium nobile]|uniref:Pectinesterase n=1 Tax=Dendrobium nobile TaxID=94219 RepID=A0A8T3B020_DENNO|nr:hypothetical protein KFK09_018013 [Dendrobium nobile]